MKTEDAGLWRIKLKNPASTKENSDKAIPVAVSNIIPVVTRLSTSASLFVALRLAMFFVIAEFIPQSLNRIIMSEGTAAIVYKPYSADERSLVRIIVPIAIIRVDVATPTSSWNPPVAEVLPILMAFSIFNDPSKHKNRFVR